MIQLEWEQDSNLPLQVPPTLLSSYAMARAQAKRFRVFVCPLYEYRSKNQNGLFHAKVNEIAKATNVDRDYLKWQIKLFATGRGYPCELDEEGLPKIENGYPVPKTTKEATVEEMEILIDSLFEWAFDRGIYIEERR